MMRECFSFGRLRLAPIDPAAAVRWVLAEADRGRSCVVVTSNIHHLALAEHDQRFAEILDRAELNVADGWPLVFANRLLGAPRLPGRVAGVDLVASVLTGGTRKRVAVLGGAPGAAEKLAVRYAPYHDFVLIDPLPVGSWEDAASIEDLRQKLRLAAPNITLVAIGAPRQEFLADSLRADVQGPLLCCGAAVEMLAGIRPRAPGWVQKVGLEWAFRASLEPSRLLPRYARASVAYLRVLFRGLREHRAGGT
jgi:N-acetylglucosaminyldiphosphoundecaprenol N-acetyl-beta-D-mannosaminyltransferase